MKTLIKFVTRMTHSPAHISLQEEIGESREDKKRNKDMNVYIAMGVILIIAFVVVFLKISFQALFL